MVRIYDFNIDDPNAPYLVMEYVDGMPLSEWIQMFFPISPRLLVDTLVRIAGAIKALHEAGRIHRDIKPENIMMSTDFDPKLMDFGVVKVKDLAGGTPPNLFSAQSETRPPSGLSARRKKIHQVLTSILLEPSSMRCYTGIKSSRKNINS